MRKLTVVCICASLACGAAIAQQPEPARVGPAPAQPFGPPGCLGGGQVLIETPPNQSGGTFTDTYCEICAGGEQSIAQQFTVTSPVTIGEIVMYGAYSPANTPPANPIFRILFHTSAGGIPDSNVSDQSGLAPASFTTTGVILTGGVDEYEVVLDISDVSLSAGTYFVEVFNQANDTDDDWFWEYGGPADPNAGGYAYAFDAPGVNWFADSIPHAVTLCDTEPVPVGLMGFDID